jgi:hypothetical protein
MKKPMSPTDYKILVLCDESDTELRTRQIFSLLVSEFKLHLNYGYLCNKCSALAKLGWLNKHSKNYGNRNGSMRGWPSFYKTTATGRKMTKKYHRWRIVNKQKSSGSGNSDLRNYL